MSTQDSPRVALIGPGAIGTTIAAVMHEVGRTPTIMAARLIRSLNCVSTAARSACRGR
ncbi:2-dehydropantoate 2-reductase [Ewingella americana]|uniref:2-dehydropantoate 2-reductase n=1 Tax=Ewingella americana TaxID=41202 RepID=A0A377NE50_9GAMM|nr:2-dehydropantoate 2-reductase [Ewingella americana]